MNREPRIYGLLAEFDGPEKLIEAAEKVREAGYKRTDAYSPFPVHGLAEAMGRRGIRIPLIVLAGGILGGLGGFLLQAYAATYGGARDDVANYFKTPGLAATGYAVTLPAGFLVNGPHKVTVRVIAADGKGYFESPAIPFTVD